MPTGTKTDYENRAGSSNPMAEYSIRATSAEICKHNAESPMMKVCPVCKVHFVTSYSSLTWAQKRGNPYHIAQHEKGTCSTRCMRLFDKKQDTDIESELLEEDIEKELLSGG